MNHRRIGSSDGQLSPRIVVACAARRNLLLVTPMLALLAATLTHGEDTPPPATAPAATQPAATQAADAMPWIDKIDKASRDIKGLTAKLHYVYIQGAMSDQQVRNGELVYASGPPARFYAHFASLIFNKRRIEQDRSYIFDGQWLVEKHADEKTFVKRQVVPPNTPPEQADPLTHGEGPFPLPITLHKEVLLARYTAVLAPADKDDPPNSVHLVLTPRPNTRNRLTRVDLWYDKQKLVPVRGASLDDSENQSTIELLDVELNPKIDEAKFDTTPPGVGSGWNVVTTPWKD